MPPDTGPTLVSPPAADSSSGSTVQCQVSEGSAVSNDDSGYGSNAVDETAPTEAEHVGQAPAEGRTVSSATTSIVHEARNHPHAAPSRRMFCGLTVFNPSQAQLQRYDEILDCITLPLNNHLQKRTRLAVRSKPKRVDAVRLIVMGASQETAKPHVVFFCNPDSERSIKDLLAKPMYQQLFQPGHSAEMSFCYKVVPSGITLRAFFSENSDNIEDDGWEEDDFTIATTCGAPIRLYTGDSDQWRRATLGGILKVTTKSGQVIFYGMTAGHFLDSWTDADDSDETEEENQGKSCACNSPIGEPDTSDIHTNEDSSPWDFKKPIRIEKLITAGTQSLSSNSLYFDWALFELRHWKPNAVVRSGTSDFKPITAVTSTPVRTSTSRAVVVMTASCGVIDGFLQAGRAKIAIDPGKEVVDVYIITLYAYDIQIRISDGDSGSWVVDEETNELLGHVVASDILGDVYVIPIHDTLHDIRHQLHLDTVSLPTADDVTGRLNSHDSQIPSTPKKNEDRYSHHATVINASATAQNPHVTSIPNLIERTRDLQHQIGSSGPEFREVSTVLEALHRVVKHLHVEAQEPDSVLNLQEWKSRALSRKLIRLTDDCNFTLNQLASMVKKIKLDGIPATPRQIDVIALIRTELTNQKTNIDIFLDTVQLHIPSWRHVAHPMSTTTAQLDTIKGKIDSIMSRLLYGGGIYGTEESLWRRFYEELVSEGFSRVVLSRHKGVLRAYMRELDSNGLLRAGSDSSIHNLLPVTPASPAVKLPPTLSLSPPPSENRLSPIARLIK